MTARTDPAMGGTLALDFLPMGRLAELEECPRHRGVEDAVTFDLVVHVSQSAAVSVDGEVRDGPDDLAEEEDHRSDVEELQPKTFVPALNDLQPDRLGVLGLDLVVPAVGRFEWSEEELADLDVGAAANVLSEVRAARSEHPGDLGPVDGGRVAARYEVEGTVGEGQRRIFGIGHEDGAERMQQRCCLRGVRWPTFGRHHCSWEVLGSCAGEHFTTTGLDVQRSGRRGKLLAEETLVPPGRALFRGPSVQPGEVPAFDWHCGRLIHERVERCVHDSIESSLRGWPWRLSDTSPNDREMGLPPRS